MENTLTVRAERALLGAILVDPESVKAALTSARIDASDFKSDDHWLLYPSIRAGDGIPEMEHKLAELRASCPVPLHGPAYAAMVVEASNRRFLTDKSRGPADWATGQLTRRLADAVCAAGSGAYEYAARAVRITNFGHFVPDTIGVPARPARGEGPASEEDSLLAALIQQHPQTDEVMRAFFPAALADRLQNRIYEAIRTLYTARWPIDSLTVEWELGRSRSMQRDGPGDSWRVAGDSEPSYVDWLTQVPIAASGKFPNTQPTRKLTIEVTVSL